MDNVMFISKIHEKARQPLHVTDNAAGLDLYCTSATTKLKSNEIRKFPTGLTVVLPKGCYGRIATKSSLAIKGLVVLGGVIDNDYTGEIIVILQNTSQFIYVIDDKLPIAQLICERISIPKFIYHNATKSPIDTRSKQRNNNLIRIGSCKGHERRNNGFGKMTNVSLFFFFKYFFVFYYNCNLH